MLTPLQSLTTAGRARLADAIERAIDAGADNPNHPAAVEVRTLIELMSIWNPEDGERGIPETWEEAIALLRAR